MLQALRQNSRNAIIYVLFGILIAAFILSFGPGSRTSSAAPGTSYAARIGDHTVSETEFRSAFIASGGGQGQMARAQQLRELVMEGFIQRELLAQEAEHLGFDVSRDEAEDAVARGHMLLLGREHSEADYFKDGKFDYEKFKLLVQNHLGLTIPHFLEEQRRELLAERMRELLRTSAHASVDEVKADWLNQQTQLNLEFVRFVSRPGEEGAEPTAAEIDAYVKAHDADLKKQYDERSFLYKKMDHEVRLRAISWDVAKDAPDADAMAKAKAVADKVKGGASFAELARAEGSDDKLKKRGGLLGWRKKGFTGLLPAVEEKVLTAKKGTVVGPEKSDRGVSLFYVEDVREGDWPFEAAARELAEDALKQERAKARATTDADAMLAKVKAGEKLESLTAQSAGSDAEEAGAKGGDKPKLQETGLFSRRGEAIPSIGISRELAKKAWELKPGEVAGPFTVGSGVVIVRVKEKKDADPAEFDKKKDEIVKAAVEKRAMQALGNPWPPIPGAFTKEKCAEAKQRGLIKINDEVMSYEGKAAVVKYEPCQNPLAGLF